MTPIRNVQQVSTRGLSPAEVDEVARHFLGPVAGRLAHVRTAGRVAQRLAVLFEPWEAELLVAAASLHDIGYSPEIAVTGFHPLDGALFLLANGFPPRLAALVAHHSLAVLTAPGYGIDDLEAQFPREVSLLTDALVYADMHSAPDGRLVPVGVRLADIERRHDRPGDGHRSQLLRAAVVRVGVALVGVQEHPRTVDLTDCELTDAVGDRAGPGAATAASAS